MLMLCDTSVTEAGTFYVNLTCWSQMLFERFTLIKRSLVFEGKHKPIQSTALP